MIFQSAIGNRSLENYLIIQLSVLLLSSLSFSSLIRAFKKQKYNCNSFSSFLHLLKKKEKKDR